MRTAILSLIEISPPSGGNGFPFAGLLDGAKAGDTGPQAYLNILVFDENLAFVDGAFVPVTTAAMENGTNVPHEKLSGEIVVQQPGYAYIYLSNDNDQPLEVFFDDFTVEHVHSAIVQADDYYPFGMTFNSYKRGNSVGNKFKFNGKEIQEETGWYDYGARFYDPALGRFSTLDPLAADYDNLSPYGYCAGNPIKYIDVNGEFIGTIIGTVVGGVSGAYDSYKKGGDVWAGAAEGAVSGAIAGAAVDLVVGATVATGGGALVVIGAGAAGGAIGGAAGGAVGKGLQAASNSTKAVQGTMSKNITETSKTLTKMGADEKTVGTAVNKITTGMGEAGRNTVNTTNKVAAGTGMATESAIKVGQMQKEENK